MLKLLMVAALALTACATEVESYETPDESTEPAVNACAATEPLTSACQAKDAAYASGWPAQGCPMRDPVCDRVWVTTDRKQLVWCCP